MARKRHSGHLEEFLMGHHKTGCFSRLTEVFGMLLLIWVVANILGACLKFSGGYVDIGCLRLEYAKEKQ
jgi:hypothetical protein